MALTVDELIERDGPSCVWCGRTPWRRNRHRDEAARQLRRLGAACDEGS